jgi:hypothetical protein
VLVVLTTIMVIGTAEGTWSVGTVDGLSFSLVALILTGASPLREVAAEPTEVRPARIYRGPPVLEPSPAATRTR